MSTEASPSAPAPSGPATGAGSLIGRSGGRTSRPAPTAARHQEEAPCGRFRLGRCRGWRRPCRWWWRVSMGLLRTRSRKKGSCCALPDRPGGRTRSAAARGCQRGRQGRCGEPGHFRDHVRGPTQLCRGRLDRSPAGRRDLLRDCGGHGWRLPHDRRFRHGLDLRDQSHPEIRGRPGGGSQDEDQPPQEQRVQEAGRGHPSGPSSSRLLNFTTPRPLHAPLPVGRNCQFSIETQ
jgi:hypothetical protein